MNPLRLYGVQPRALLREKATDDPHSQPALLGFSVASSEPPPDLFGDVPTGVVPDEKQNLLARRFEFLQAPLKELRRYGAYRPPIHEPQPRLVDLGQVEAVAGDGLRLGVVFGNRPLKEAQRLSLLGEAAQGRQGHPAPPALVLETDGPLGVAVGHRHQPVTASFFSRTGGRER